MAKDNRTHFTRRTPYHTPSNRVKLVKTPGGKLSVQYRTKHAAVPKCGDCGSVIHGVKATRPAERHSMSKRQKTVSRTYGGSRCAKCVRDRIVRAFLVEEKKAVKALMKAARNKVVAGPKKTVKKSKK